MGIYLTKVFRRTILYGRGQGFVYLTADHDLSWTYPDVLSVLRLLLSGRGWLCPKRLISHTSSWAIGHR